MRDLVDFVLLSLATARITLFVTTDTLAAPLREKIWKRYPPESSRYGYLITCNWCTGIYAATLVASMYRIVEKPMIFVSTILALSFVAGFAADRAR
jgi:hypothetical protein